MSSRPSSLRHVFQLSLLFVYLKKQQGFTTKSNELSNYLKVAIAKLVKFVVMPRGTRQGRIKSVVVDNHTACALQQTSDKESENLNDNHSDDMIKSNRKRYLSDVSIKRTKGKGKRTKRDKVNEEELDYEDDLPADEFETAQFEEGNNLVEIAVHEGDHSQFPSEGESDDDLEMSDIEEGEVTDRESNNASMRADSEAEQSDIRVVKNKSSRRSMEQKIEEQNSKLQELSSTLKSMQEIMMKQGGYVNTDRKESGKQKSLRKTTPKKKASGGETEQLDISIFEETIYKDALDKQSVEERMVDPEIVFKIKDNRRGSSSSEDQVNTSDELMDVENFIADCEAMAKSGNMNEDR